MSLEDFGATTQPVLREVVRDDSGNVVCPVSRAPIEYSHGEISLPVVRLVDDRLQDALQEDGVETVRSIGWDSYDYDVLIPDQVNGPEAASVSSRFVGVQAELRSGKEVWVPVRQDDLPDLEPESIDEYRNDSSDRETSASDQGQTRVGHCKEDDTDVYIGRHGDGGENHLLNTEIGEPGWLGNPYPADEFGRQEAVEMFMRAFLVELENRPEFRRAVADLQGQTLGCWCQRLEDDSPRCHGEVIARVADDVLVPAGGDGGE